MHRFAGLILLAWLASGCSYEVGYEPEYVPSDEPSYVAQGKLLLVLHQADRQYVYKGPPSSDVGDFTTLTIPLGMIMDRIAQDVFGSCFAYGVAVSDSLDPAQGYVLAIEPDLSQFMYRYTRILNESFEEQAQDESEAEVVPEVQVGLSLKAYDHAANLVLDKNYQSGIVAGESYTVTSHPEERINQAVHAALHRLMVQAAEDIRPLLVGECEISERDAQN
jgi:hypothetical protein